MPATCRDAFHLGKKPVADAMQGLDVAGILGVVAERLAQMTDDAIEHTGSDMAMAPDLIQQVVAGQCLAGTFEQGDQYREGLGLQIQVNTLPDHPARARVDFDVAETVGDARHVHQGIPCPGPPRKDNP